MTRKEGGFTLLAVLGLVAVIGLAAAIAGPLWAQAQRREQERELLRVGLLYARALASYRDTLPGSIRSYPYSLDELLRDRRLQSLQRHLRRKYPDPMTPGGDWGLVTDEFGRIVGVHSRSVDEPIVCTAVALEDRVLPPARRYADWKFIALPTP